MTRLRDENSDDPLMEAGVALLRQTPATRPMPEMKHRVWAALTSKDALPVVVPRMLRAPVIAAAAVVLFAAGTAGAVIARRFIVPALHQREPAAAPVSLAPPPPPRRAAATRASVAEPVAIAEPPAPVRPNRVRRVMAPLSDKSVVHDDAVAAPTPRERAQVLDAMIALRRDHDAARAGQLLDRYLTASPHGALREEALALAIEAADARGDRAGVATWAHAYQADYPAGRFAAYARSHLTSP